MQRKLWLVGGAFAACLAACFMPWNVHAGTGTQVADVALPDLDGDGKADHLRIETAEPARVLVKLDATAGKFTHEVLSVASGSAPHLTGESPRWQVLDAANQPLFDIRVVSEPGRAQPDLVVLGGGGGKRYRFVERGFLKLDATTVVPGYAVGIAMLGDSPTVLGQLGDRASASGAWSPAAPAGVQLSLTPGPDGRLEGIHYDSPAFVSTNGMATGALLVDLALRFPGRRAGDLWFAPNYGMTVQLDTDGKAKGFDLKRPWIDSKAAAPAKGK
jgi:hypothetical protein